MPRLLLVIAVVGLTVYCLIDVAQTPAADVRVLPKPAWLLAIVATTVVGSVWWLVAGRPRGPLPRSGPPRRHLPPDDDPDFLRSL